MRAPLAGLCLAALVALAACGGGSSSGAPLRPFCDAASRYESELEREAQNGKLDTARQIAIVEQLAKTAPSAVRGDAQTFLAALRQVQADPRLRDNPSVKTAVDNVNRYASNKCGFFNTQGGGM